jgi:hypothetical protein
MKDHGKTESGRLFILPPSFFLLWILLANPIEWKALKHHACFSRLSRSKPHGAFYETAYAAIGCAAGTGGMPDPPDRLRYQHPGLARPRIFEFPKWW